MWMFHYGLRFMLHALHQNIQRKQKKNKTNKIINDKVNNTIHKSPLTIDDGPSDAIHNNSDTGYCQICHRTR